MYKLLLVEDDPGIATAVALLAAANGIRKAFDWFTMQIGE